MGALSTDTLQLIIVTVILHVQITGGYCNLHCIIFNYFLRYRCTGPWLQSACSAVHFHRDAAPQDYPSIGMVNHFLVERGISPIFLVASSFIWDVHQVSILSSLDQLYIITVTAHIPRSVLQLVASQLLVCPAHFSLIVTLHSRKEQLLVTHVHMCIK